MELTHGKNKYAGVNRTGPFTSPWFVEIHGCSPVHRAQHLQTLVRVLFVESASPPTAQVSTGPTLLTPGRYTIGTG